MKRILNLLPICWVQSFFTTDCSQYLLANYSPYRILSPEPLRSEIDSGKPSRFEEITCYPIGIICIREKQNVSLCPTKLFIKSKSPFTRSCLSQQCKCLDFDPETSYQLLVSCFHIADCLCVGKVLMISWDYRT